MVNTIPDSRAALRTIIKGIHSGLPYKMGTEHIFRKFPHLLDVVAPDLAKFNDAFGDYFANEKIGLFLTIPVFMAGGVPAPKEGMNEPGQNITSVRTDFHAEPIANVIMQMEGKKVRLLHFSGCVVALVLICSVSCRYGV